MKINQFGPFFPFFCWYHLLNQFGPCSRDLFWISDRIDNLGLRFHPFIQFNSFDCDLCRFFSRVRRLYVSVFFQGGLHKGRQHTTGYHWGRSHSSKQILLSSSSYASFYSILQPKVESDSNFLLYLLNLHFPFLLYEVMISWPNSGGYSIFAMLGLLLDLI